MAFEKCCNVCANAWGENSILMCALHSNHCVYEDDVCDDFSPLKEGQKRNIHYPPEIVMVAGVTYEMEGIDRHLIEGSVKFVKNHPGPLDVVIDLGAHVGTFSLWCARKGATVYAFEPSDKNIRLLKANIEHNADLLTGRVFPIQLAVTDRTGDTLALRYAGVGSGQRSLYFNENHPVENEVETISLKDMLTDILAGEEKVDYLKCDIEGAEWKFCDMDPQTRELIGRIGFVEMSLHPLSNKEYFAGEDIDYAKKMTDWLLSCGLPPERFTLG